MARSTFPERFVKLAGMITWAIFDGRFEPDTERRIPVSARRGAASLLGKVAVRRSGPAPLMSQSLMAVGRPGAGSTRAWSVKSPVGTLPGKRCLFDQGEW